MASINDLRFINGQWIDTMTPDYLFGTQTADTINVYAGDNAVSALRRQRYDLRRIAPTRAATRVATSYPAVKAMISSFPASTAQETATTAMLASIPSISFLMATAFSSISPVMLQRTAPAAQPRKSGPSKTSSAQA